MRTTVVYPEENLSRLTLVMEAGTIAKVGLQAQDQVSLEVPFQFQMISVIFTVLALVQVSSPIRSP